MPRHQVDFRKLAVVIPIVLPAWQSFRHDSIPKERFAPSVPYVGGVLTILALGIG